jgi:nucleoside-diphosphate kinase
MAIEQTLSIIKPDGVKKGVMGEIVKRFENAGLNVIAMKMKTLSMAEAEGFYAVHRERPFFGELTEFMTSGPVVLMILEGENAISRNRELMGATNPSEAAPGTNRARFGCYRHGRV